MSWYGLAVHGNAFVPERMAGDIGADGPLIQVDGVPKSDYTGLHRGWGVSFRGKRNHRNWFHVPLPSLELFDHSPATLGELQVFLQVTESAFVENIHVFNGATRLDPPARFEGLRLTGDFAHVFSEPVSLPSVGLGLSLEVAFEASDSTITFTGAYARYVTPH